MWLSCMCASYYLYFVKEETKTQERCNLPTIFYQVVVLVFEFSSKETKLIATAQQLPL